MLGLAAKAQAGGIAAVVNTAAISNSQQLSSMKTPPRHTAFFTTSQLCSLLSPQEQTLADHSWVEYAPYPYKWIERCKGNSNGLGLAEGGSRLTREELGEYDKASVQPAPQDEIEQY
ncbi:uncharacterized protein BDV17DRAFT_101034 [Aspergillus undulatus]|uniref:uncharacterized protein n=1 Tax=Aspergillus undulatus TaxID=1810928 RepID=UPI003CCDB4F3